MIVGYAEFIMKRNKEGRKYRRLLDVSKTDDCEKKLTKAVTGPIRINYNNKGQLFGFVRDYYVPGYLLVGIEDDDHVVINIVYDGERWKAFSAEKASITD